MHNRQQHRNARLTPRVRQDMVNRIDNGEITRVRAGRIYGIHRNTVSKWVKGVDETGNWLCLDKPGELVHIDTKKLPFIEGEANRTKEYLYVAVDDATRYLYTAVMGDKTNETAGEFMEEVLTTSPFIIEAIMTDNGREYKGKLERGHRFETVLDRENIKHVYTKIKTPKTNGKAERIMRTIMAWHRMIQFRDREERSYRLSDFVEWYNSKKGHSSLKGETPFEFIVTHLKLCEKCTQRWQS